jgi:hypothetical protein
MLLSINGLQPAKISSNVLRILPGSCASADGKFEVSLRAPIDIDMMRVGFDGLDAGQIAEGEAYFPYLVRKRTSGEIGGVLSRSRFYGSPAESVVVPADCQILRKLRFGFRYRATWDGIPNFHYDHGAFVLLTGEDSPAFRIGMPHMQSGGAWASVSLADLMPDNARVARVSALVLAGTEAGSAWIATPTIENYGRFCGSKDPGERNVSPVVQDIRVSSKHVLKFKTIGGARLNLYLHGYAMTEPS